MLAILLAAWTLWVWTPNTLTSDNKTWVLSTRPVPIPKEYNSEAHCLNSFAARKEQGYLPKDARGECLPSGTAPSGW